MSLLRRSRAVLPGTTARHARRAPSGPRWAWTATGRPGGAAAAAVVLVGLTGGLGAGAVVQASGAVPPAVAAQDETSVAQTAPDRAAVLSRSGTRTPPPGLVAGLHRGDDDLATAGDARAAGDAADGDAGTVAGGVRPAAGVPGDVRPVPVPTLLPPGAPGPVWLTETDRADGLLSVDVPESGSGVLDVVPGSAPAPGSASVRTVRVEVEQGLPVDGQAFAATVMTTLNDPRGWGAQGAVTFARTDGPADVRVVLASPATVDALCAPLRTDGQVSCGRNGHAALNFRRWVEATDEFTDRHLYRQYLVNHEVGHLLGHPHEDCPGAGQPAPIMQQQSYTVAPCTPNGWPFP